MPQLFHSVFCDVYTHTFSSDETCGEPGTLPDADIVQSARQSASSFGGYDVGDSVTYKCRTGNETLQRTCMSDGEWSPAGYVCGGLSGCDFSSS